MNKCSFNILVYFCCFHFPSRKKLNPAKIKKITYLGNSPLITEMLVIISSHKDCLSFFGQQKYL